MSEKKEDVKTIDSEYQNLNQMTLSGWLDYHQKNVVFDKVSWMGIPTLKTVLDLWIYQELIYSLRPDLIIEMGSFKGGSTLYLAQMLEQIGHGCIISVDLDHSHFMASHTRITTVTGSTQDPAIIERLKGEASGRSVMIIHDADHSRNMVLADLQTYADLVSKNSYFIVEDGVVDLFAEDTLLGSTMGGPGPLPAVRKFLEQDQRFIIDRSCERYLLTYNPCGYLKKIAE